MGVFSIFRRGGFDPEGFERELTTLTESITATNQQISRLKVRSKSITRTLFSYLATAYVLVGAYGYLALPPGAKGRNKIEIYFTNQSRAMLLILSLYPIAGAVVLRSVRVLFDFLIRSRTSHLKALKKKHKEKIDELKKITNFTTTEKLLSKYGDKQDTIASSAAKQGPARTNNLNGPVPANPANQPSQLSAAQLKKLNINITPQPPVLTPQEKEEQRRQLHAQMQNQSQLPTKRSFQDRLLDVLIGSDNNESVENRYALICYNCFNHNGLAPPGTTNPADVRYVCFKCGTMNGKSVFNDEWKQMIDGQETPETGLSSEISREQTRSEAKSEKSSSSSSSGSIVTSTAKSEVEPFKTTEVAGEEGSKTKIANIVNPTDTEADNINTKADQTVEGADTPIIAISEAEPTEKSPDLLK
ncbi:uncharacterized protein RJT20DRAFT_4859 [Scheffersomyces xylosifermentans]|uniref:uncharacterized protein n=1 Tax=Scheffersomyces xylosifermentans TaxID=1304137 RepID=UPI00315CB1F8